MINNISIKDIRHGRDRAVRIRSIVATGARYGFVLPQDVDLTRDVAETEESARHNGDEVVVVVDTFEVRHLRTVNVRLVRFERERRTNLGVEKVCVARIPHAWGTECYAFDRDGSGEIQLEVEGIELSQCTAE